MVFPAADYPITYSVCITFSDLPTICDVRVPGHVPDLLYLCTILTMQ